MKDWGFTRKFLYGSLAVRVLGVSILLLAIPLILYSLVVFRIEQRQKTKDVLSALNILGDSRVQTIENEINFQKNWLEEISDHGSITAPSSFSQTLLLEKSPSGQYKVVHSSNADRVGETLFDHKVFSEDKYNPIFVFPDYDPYISKRSLFVGKKIRDGKWVFIETPLSYFVEPFGGIQNLDYDIGRSILDQHGNFLQSSDGFLLGKNLKKMIDRPLHFISFHKSAEAFAIHEEQLNYAVRLPIPQTDLYLLLDSPESSLLRAQKRQVVYKIIFLWALILVVGGACAVLITWRLGKPLHQLSNLMKIVGKGDLLVRFEKDPLGFEINSLGFQFNQMIESIIHHQKQVEKERLQKERLAEELKIGRKIQHNIFPSHFPAFEDLDLAAGFLPAKEVGGDFYDVYQISPHKILLVMADAAGKGIPACLYSLGVRSMIRSYAASGRSLEKIVERTNHLFCEDAGNSGIFVTAWVGIYDIESKELEYHSAGHLPALLRHKNHKVTELHTKGIALGVIPLQEVETKTIHLRKGDSLLLYTDGVIEAQNCHKKLYGKDRLHGFFTDEPFTSSKAVVESLLRDVQSFSEKEPQFDDITLLVVSLL